MIRTPERRAQLCAETKHRLLTGEGIARKFLPLAKQEELKRETQAFKKIKRYIDWQKVLQDRADRAEKEARMHSIPSSWCLVTHYSRYYYCSRQKYRSPEHIKQHRGQRFRPTFYDLVK